MENNDTLFGFWLRSYMRSKGLSQADIVRKTGLDDGTVNKHFHGFQSPSFKTLKIYAKALDLPIELLIQENGRFGEEGITARDKVYRIFRELSFENRAKLITFGESLLLSQTTSRK